MVDYVWSTLEQENPSNLADDLSYRLLVLPPTGQPNHLAPPLVSLGTLSAGTKLLLREVEKKKTEIGVRAKGIFS
jgi:hypothetical protein